MDVGFDDTTHEGEPSGMRKALLVGIDHYPHLQDLGGCVSDATAMAAMLKRNADQTVNFDTRLITGSHDKPLVQRTVLKQELRQLFACDGEIALFYFAGHGYVEDVGGYLCTGECREGDDGLSLAELMTIASRSPARNRVIILDSCHSGFAGNRADSPLAELREGTTILTASTSSQTAQEHDGRGVFTSLVLDALGGAAANLTGNVTPGSLYAHVDLSLGQWMQRPVFKTNVKSFVSLRRAAAPIPLADLQAIPVLFPQPDAIFALDPSYEPKRNPGEENLPKPVPAHTETFARLQRLFSVDLVDPDGAEHMYFAAMDRKGCKLTALGRHYWQLAHSGCI